MALNPPKPELAPSARGLARLNFFLADVRDGLGPFLGVFLMTQGWRADAIGYVMAAAGAAGMLATVPLGAWVDHSRAKRGLLAGGIVVLLAANVALWAWPSPAVTAVTQIASAVVGALIGPALMGITLGLVTPQALPRQLGLNEAWNHAGNVAAAAFAGTAGYVWGLPAVFLLMLAMGVGALLCLARIRAQDIDHDAARGFAPGAAGPPAAMPGLWKVLRQSHDLRHLGLVLALFHLGNAAMLPLLGQAVVSRGQADPAAYTAITVIVAQLVMIPVALAAGRQAARRGYWVLVTWALSALVLRGAVAGAWTSPWAVVPVQVLDGVGAGLLGVAVPGRVAQILHGTGHVNAGLGAIMAVQGVGAALSPALAGWIAHRAGYATAFFVLAACAAAGLAVFAWGFRSRRSSPDS